MKYRKKPVEIDAMQFIYTKDGISELKSFVGESLGPITKSRTPTARAEAEILTLEDGCDNRVAHVATEGDWIICGVQGEFYPCKQDIFEVTYEPAIYVTAGFNDSFAQDEHCNGCGKLKVLCTHSTTGCM